MSKREAEIVLRHIHRMAAASLAEPAQDRVLLDRFAVHRDEAAFAALLDRYAALVLRVCRRILHDTHEAEDAFQATFLILARKAGTIRKHQSLGSWLYTVSYHIAIRARAAAVRRTELPADAPRRSAVDPLAEVSGRELMQVLDDELQRLPEKYRAPLLLCYLEGQTQDEAARRLGWSPQTLRGRVERGRTVLRRRLIRRGFGLPAALAGTLLEQTQAPAAVSAALIAHTLRAAGSSAEPTAGVSAHVAALVQCGLSAPGAARLKLAVSLLLMLAVLGAGAGLTGLQAPAEKTPAEQSSAPPAHARDADKSVTKRDVDGHGDPLPAGAVFRLGTTRLRHAGRVHGVAYSPDGKLLASGGADERLRVWDAETGKELRQFHLGRKGPGASSVDGVAFSPDGKLLAAGGWGTELALWDVATGKEVHRQGGVTRYVLFSPDSRTVVLGGFPNQGVGVLELPSNKRRRIPLGVATTYAVAFAPDGKLLAAAGPKNQVSLWDADSLQERRSCRGHEGEVRSLDFAPDGKLLVSAGMDKTIRLWDAASSKEIRCFQATGAVDGVRYSPDGKLIAARSDGRAILLLDVKSGKKLHQFAVYSDSLSFPMAFSPDGKKLLAAQGNALQVWETATGKELFPTSGIHESIDNLAYADGGQTLATVSWDGTIRLWEMATYRELRRFGGQQPGTRSLAFSTDGRLVATAGGDKTTRLWDAATGKELFHWDTDLNDGFNLAFTPDGRVLASANGDGCIQLWRTDTGKPLRRLKGHSRGPVYGVVFSPDGQTLLSAALDKTLRLWDWNAGRELRAFTGHTGWVMAADFAPDGRTVVSAGDSDDRFIRLWDVKTGKELRRFEGHEEGLNTAFSSIVFSPDGRMLASAGFGETIRLWEAATGKERCRFHGQDYRIEKVAFSPDGRVLVSAGMDGTVLLWDATGRHLDGRPRRQRLTRQEWETCWRDLADHDARLAYRALQALVADPEQSVTRFKGCVRVVTAADAKRTAQLIRELDSDDFAVRTKAEEELAKQGESVRTTLEQTLKGKPSLEVRQRIGRLLEQLEPEHSPPQLRLLRAVEAVEQMRTPNARQLLEIWSEGISTARLTREAKASLDRWPRRTAP